MKKLVNNSKQQGNMFLETLLLLPFLVAIILAVSFIAYELLIYNSLKDSIRNLSRNITLLDPLVDLAALQPGSRVECVLDIKNNMKFSCDSIDKKDFLVNGQGIDNLSNIFSSFYELYNVKYLYITYDITDLPDPADPFNLYLPIITVMSEDSQPQQTLMLPKVSSVVLDQGGKSYI